MCDTSMVSIIYIVYSPNQIQYDDHRNTASMCVCRIYVLVQIFVFSFAS